MCGKWRGNKAGKKFSKERNIKHKYPRSLPTCHGWSNSIHLGDGCWSSYVGVWLVVDLICTLVFCAFALCSTIPMLKDIFGILMEKTPHEINVCWMECSLKYRSTRYSWPACLGYHSREVSVVLPCSSWAWSHTQILDRIRDYCEKNMQNSSYNNINWAAAYRFLQRSCSPFLFLVHLWMELYQLWQMQGLLHQNLVSCSVPI